MPTPIRPPQLVRAELIRLDTNLQAADARGDADGFERWARQVLDHPCAPHTWTIGLVADMLADVLVDRDAVDEAAEVVRASIADGQVAEPFATLRIAELALLAGDRDRAEDLWATLATERVPAVVALAIGFLLEDVAGDHEAAHTWFTRGVEDLLAAAEDGQMVDLGELDDLLEAREQTRIALGLPASDELGERALDVPLPLEDAPPHEEYPPHPSTLVECERCGFVPGREDEPIADYRMAVPWDPATGPSPEVDARLRQLRADAGTTPVLVAARAADVAAWAEPYGYATSTDGADEPSEAADLYAAVAPSAQVLPWPPSRNEPCWCGSGVKYKRCCGR